MNEQDFKIGDTIQVKLTGQIGTVVAISERTDTGWPIKVQMLPLSDPLMFNYYRREYIVKIKQGSQNHNNSVETTLTREMPPGTAGKKVDGKPHLCYIDPHLLLEMGVGMRKGAIKHGFNNHRQLTKESSQEILDSTFRHLVQFLAGEQVDSELNISHLACVVNNINFLYRLVRKNSYDEVLNNIYGEAR